MFGRLDGAWSQLWKLAPLFCYAITVYRILDHLSAVGELRGGRISTSGDATAALTGRRTEGIRDDIVYRDWDGMFCC